MMEMHTALPWEVGRCVDGQWNVWGPEGQNDVTPATMDGGPMSRGDAEYIVASANAAHLMRSEAWDIINEAERDDPDVLVILSDARKIVAIWDAAAADAHMQAEKLAWIPL